MMYIHRFKPLKLRRAKCSMANAVSIWRQQNKEKERKEINSDMLVFS